MRQVAPGTTERRWWNDVEPDQWKTLAGTWTGWVLDAFDFTLLLLVLADIGKTFGVSLVAMGTVVTGTLFCRLFGGLLFGMWADRAGRLLPLMVSIASFSFFSLLTALAPNFALFFLVRLLFGIGMGGEWAAGTPLAMENWPRQHRGIASGILQGGWPVGYLLATLVYFVVFPLWGWRALFIVGAFPALLVLFIRRKMPESPVYLERQEQLRQRDATLTDRFSLVRLFQPDLVRTTIHAFVVMGAMMFTYYALNTFWPTFLGSAMHLGVGGKTLFLVCLNASSLVGYWVAGWLSERFGRRPTLIGYALLAIASLPLFSLATTAWVVLIGGILVGALGVGLWGVIPAYLSERFPTSARAAGSGTAYHVGAAVGSFAATVVALIHTAGPTLGQAIAIGGAIALAAVAISAGVGPEPKGREFVADN